MTGTRRKGGGRGDWIHQDEAVNDSRQIINPIMIILNIGWY